MANQTNLTPSRTSPKGGKRGCLCKDTLKYSVKCCDGTLWSQGIGPITGIENNNIYLITQNDFNIITQDNNKIII